MASGMLGWLIWLPDFDGIGKGRVVCTVDAWFDQAVFPLRDLVSPMSPCVNVDACEHLDLESYRMNLRESDLPSNLAVDSQHHDGPMSQEDVHTNMPELHENHILSDFGRTTSSSRRTNATTFSQQAEEAPSLTTAPTATPISVPPDCDNNMIGPDGTCALDYVTREVERKFKDGKLYHGTIVDTYKNDTTKWPCFRVRWNEDGTLTTHPWTHLAKLLRGESTTVRKGSIPASKASTHNPTQDEPVTVTVRFDSHSGPTTLGEKGSRKDKNLQLWQRATTSCIKTATDAQLADYCFHNTVRLRAQARMLFPDNVTYDLSVVSYDTTVDGVKVVIGGVDVDSRKAGKLFYFDTTVSTPTTTAIRTAPTVLTLRDIITLTQPNALTFADLPQTMSTDTPIVSNTGRLNRRGTPIAYGARVSAVRESRLTLTSSEFTILPAGEKEFLDSDHFSAFAAVGPTISDHAGGSLPTENGGDYDGAKQVFVAMGPDGDEESDFYYFGSPTTVPSLSVITSSSTETESTPSPPRGKVSNVTASVCHTLLMVVGAVLPNGSYDLTQAPKTQKEAYSRPDAHLWKQAEQTEMETLFGKRTFEFVDESMRGGKRVLPTRWTYALKTDGRGNVTRYKARLVARGDLQAKHTYGETSSPTARTAMIRMLLATCVKRSCFLSSFDIKCAFVSALIDTEIFISLPDGYQAPPGKVARLIHCLYGTKQASRLFAQALCEWLVEYGFVKIDDDDTLFRLDVGGEFIILSTYVDDGIACHSSQAIFDDFLSALSKRFEISSKGELNLFCGVTIDYDREAGTLKMGQEQYVKDTLRRFGMESCHQASTPLPPDTHMVTAPDDELVDEEQHAMYMQLIGSLQWVANYTRPDIAYAVNQCARFLQAPGKQHIIYARHILRYLTGTSHMGIGYTRDALPDFVQPGRTYPINYPILYGYCDADHAGDPETRISVSGFIIYMAGGPIHWGSRRQDLVALSSTEAEFYAGSVAGCEVEYFRHLLERLGYPQLHSTLLGEDNMACVYMQSKAYGALKRSKHIDTRIHRLRQLNTRGVLTLWKIPTAEQRADPLTKALSEGLHATHATHMIQSCGTRSE